MNATFKKHRFTTVSTVLFLAFVLILMSCMLAFKTSANESTEAEGLSFSKEGDADKWHLRKPLADAPYSFETWLKVPVDATSGRLGIIFSNYDGGSGTNTYYGNSTYSNRTISLEIHQNGVPRLYYGYDKNGVATAKDIKFTNVDVRTGEWMNLAIVKESDAVVCYVNGEQKQSISDSNSYHSDILLQPFAFGGENRSNNNYYFQGNIKSFTLYKDARTAEEIMSSYKYGVSTSDKNMILHYDITTPPEEYYIEDLTGNGYYAAKKSYDNYVPSVNDIGATGTGSLGSGAVDDSADESYDYSFAIVGDTQYMTRWDAVQLNGVQSSTQHLKKVYDWLLANKDKKNIKYVMGLGDITDSYNKDYSSVSSSGYGFDTAMEWKIAYEQISRLNGVIPYSVVRGNHDNETYFDKYFADNVADDDVVNTFYKSQFTDPDYESNSACFYSEDSALNAYTKFEVGTEKYLLLLLDDNPTDAVLEWAGNVIAKNPTYRVIINTHTYLGYTGGLIDDSDTYSYATKDVKEGENNGQLIWDKLVSKYENIALVLCGHDYKSSNVLRKERIGDNGNIVTELLICPQSIDVNDDSDPKAGMVAMLYFSNGGKDIRVEYIKTSDTLTSEDGADVYYNADVNNTKFSIMQSTTYVKYGYVMDSYLDTEKYPFIVFGEAGNFLGAYASLLDCVSSYDNDGAVYCAKGHMAANTWNGTSYGDNPKAATILLRRNYTYASTETYNNMAQVKGIITIDLDGHTLTANDAKALFPSTIKPWGDENTYTTQFDVINGTIQMGAKPLVTFSVAGTANNIDMSKKAFIHTFSNVKFIASPSASNLFAAYSQNNTTPEAVGNPSLIFNECVFDLSSAPQGAVVFDLDNGYVHTDVTVNGGEFISNSTGFVMSKNATEESTLAFGKTSSGIYTSITVPNGTELPITSANNGVLTAVKTAEGTTTTTYQLAPVSVTSYAPKMSITLANSFVMNVYVPVNSTQAFTFNGVTYDSSNNYGGKNATLDDGNTYYLVTLPLGSSEAAKEMKLVAKVTVGEDTANATFTFSIPKYVAKVLANENATNIEKTLAKDVLAYIKEAYNYFDTHNDAEEIERVNTLIESIIGDYTLAPVSSGVTNTVSPVTSVTLNLDAKPSIRFYVTDTTVEFFANGRKLNTVTGTDTKGTYVELDVYAYALCATVTYTGGGSYHISSFVNGSAGTAHEALVKAFVKYTESAADYRASVIGSNK